MSESEKFEDDFEEVLKLYDGIPLSILGLFVPDDDIDKLEELEPNSPEFRSHRMAIMPVVLDPLTMKLKDERFASLESVSSFGEYCKSIGANDPIFWQKIYSRIGLEYTAASPQGNFVVFPQDPQQEEPKQKADQPLIKALTAVITVLSVPLILLNLLGAVVSGVWLVIIGEWRPVGLGILFFFGSSLLLGLVLMPGLLLVAPAAFFAERRQILGVVFFGTLSNLYTLGLLTIWCCGVLFLFVKDATATSLIPLLIWSYGVATGPWSYMASQDRSPEGEGIASTLATFFAQLAYLVIMLLVLFSSITLIGAVEVFAGFMLLDLFFR